MLLLPDLCDLGEGQGMEKVPEHVCTSLGGPRNTRGRQMAAGMNAGCGSLSSQTLVEGV